MPKKAEKKETTEEKVEEKVAVKESSKKDAKKMLPAVLSMIDKLAKNNIIHKNKSANLKSKMSKHVNGL